VREEGRLWAYAIVANREVGVTTAAILALPSCVFVHREDAIYAAEKRWDEVWGTNSSAPRLDWVCHRYEEGTIFAEPYDYYVQVYSMEIVEDLDKEVMDDHFGQRG